MREDVVFRCFLDFAQAQQSNISDLVVLVASRCCITLSYLFVGFRIFFKGCDIFEDVWFKNQRNFRAAIYISLFMFSCAQS